MRHGVSAQKVAFLINMVYISTRDSVLPLLKDPGKVCPWEARPGVPETRVLTFPALEPVFCECKMRSGKNDCCLVSQIVENALVPLGLFKKCLCLLAET